VLTADLVRASVRKGVVRPRWIDPASPALLAEAERLIGLFAEHRGRTLGELQEAIADHIGDSTDFLLQRGLAKLLSDGSRFEVAAAVDPTRLRQVVLGLAAAGGWPVRPGGGLGFRAREEVLAAAAEELGLAVDEVEAGLYGDLEAEQRVTEVPVVAPGELLERYNLSLAQAVLLRAHALEVDLPGLKAPRARQLVRFIKFRRLMHRIERTEDGYRLTLDGPLSLFQQTQRYGLQLALLLPGLALAERWSLRADVVWGRDRGRCRFELDQDQGLVTRARDTGTWVGDEERHFERSWKKLDTPWTLDRRARLVELGGGEILCPDFAIRHPDGREALLEIVWFWRRQTFERRLGVLAGSGPPNLIVALAERYNTDSDPPDLDHASVYPFKGVIQPRRVLALAERVAVQRGP